MKLDTALGRVAVCTFSRGVMEFRITGLVVNSMPDSTASGAAATCAWMAPTGMLGRDATTDTCGKGRLAADGCGAAPVGQGDKDAGAAHSDGAEGRSSAWSREAPVKLTIGDVSAGRRLAWFAARNDACTCFWGFAWMADTGPKEGSGCCIAAKAAGDDTVDSTDQVPAGGDVARECSPS